MKNVNKILLSAMIIPMLLAPIKVLAIGTTTTYTVKNGDSLWKIATASKVTVDYLKLLNNLNSTNINVGQVIKLLPDTITYNIKQGDTLYLLAKKFGITIDAIKSLNHLKGTNLLVKQQLLIPCNVEQLKNASSVLTTSPPVLVQKPVVISTTPKPVKDFPSITYNVQSGNTATSIGKVFNVSAADIMKYNYMGVNDWFSEGQKIAINGYAPRDYAVTPGMNKSPTQYGSSIDWFRDGQYLLKRNDIFTIVDFATRKQFTVKVMGGYNHCDIETLTSSDTAVMKSIFSTWNWAPRPVVIFKDGMNIAASLSGMPHSFDTTPNNGISGHFDLYLKNSLPHGGSVSKSYVKQHYNNIPISSGQK
jgi:LysM repeat protein